MSDRAANQWTSAGPVQVAERLGVLSRLQDAATKVRERFLLTMMADVWRVCGLVSRKIERSRWRGQIRDLGRGRPRGC